MSEEFLVRIEDGVAVLTLNRPERLNALTRAMLSGLKTLKIGRASCRERVCLAV